MRGNNGWQSAGHGHQRDRHKLHLTQRQTTPKRQAENSTTSYGDYTHSHKSSWATLLKRSLKISILWFFIQTNTIFCCVASPKQEKKMMQAEERHYYESVCVCECVCVWVGGCLASFPGFISAPHVTHLLGPNVDQDRKTIKKKKKKRFFLLWATLTLPTTEEHRVGCFWDFVFLSFVIFRGNFTTTHTHTHTHTQATLCGSGLSGHLRPILARDIIAYVMIFISPCSSPHRADICVDKPSVREFTQL